MNALTEILKSCDKDGIEYEHYVLVTVTFNTAFSTDVQDVISTRSAITVFINRKHDGRNPNLEGSATRTFVPSVIAKFHYAIWFEAGWKLVADQLRSWLATSFEPVCDQLRTS